MSLPYRTTSIHLSPLEPQAIRCVRTIVWLTFSSSIPDLTILNDAHLLGGALLTHHCPWGIAVIAGTGSVVVALEVAKDGSVEQTGRRGGFGYLLGDDGSG